jgi:hypothetical protein
MSERNRLSSVTRRPRAVHPTVIAAAIATLASSLSGVANAQDQTPVSPRYLEAMETELEALRIPHECVASSETNAECTFRHRGATSQREFEVRLRYSDDTDTIYFYVPRYLIATPEAAGISTVMQRLMEINWELLVGKLEWDRRDGEVRLSITMNTDSNFDRRSFRSIARAIGPLADRYADELERLTESR